MASIALVRLSLLLSILLVSVSGNNLQKENKEYEENLPDPHIVILGATGAGKSSLANVLLGASPDCKNCTFQICHDHNSCTKDTTYAIGNYVGAGPLFTIVDTPGFGDTANNDSVLIDEMITVLKEHVKTANSLLILFNGEDERFNPSLQQMLREMEALFGKDNLWSHAIMGVSHWSFSLAEQYQRNFTGKTEDWWTADMNAQLQATFHLTTNLSAVFIDSYAKMPFSLDDEVQQTAFQRESQKLWDLTLVLDPFEFKTIEDILYELTECKVTMEANITEIWRVIESHDQSLTNLSSEMESHDQSLTNLSSEMESFDQSIADLSSEIDLHDQSIAAHSSAIEKNSGDLVILGLDLGELSDDIIVIYADQDDMKNDVQSLFASQEDSTADISRLEDSISNTNNDIFKFINESSPPLGSILPWTNRPNKDTTNFASSVPVGWQLCDGNYITATSSPWLGQRTPNLNDRELFLRGSSTWDTLLDVEEDTFQDHTHVDPGHTHTDGGHLHVMNAHRHRYPAWQPQGKIKMDNGKENAYSDGEYTEYATSTMKTGYADIKSSRSGIGGVSTGPRKGVETRPKNMRVMYIMRIF